MIRVCDAIMGTGKSSAAINYMNDHSNEKFIYITPYLDEARRIKDKCPKLHFVEPSKKIRKYGFSKVIHTQHLIEEGRNITSTHAAFKSYSPEILSMIRDQDYTLIVDESIDILEDLECHADDLQLLVDAGYISEEDGRYSIINDTYGGSAFKDMFKLLKSRNLVRVSRAEKEVLYYWILPPDFFAAFKDVFILTYMFTGQGIHHLFEIYKYPYTYIGIEKDGDEFRFSETSMYVPEYVKNLDSMIEVYDGPMNDIGKNFHALSVSWFERSSNNDNIEKLKNHLYNYFTHKMPDSNAGNRLWSTFNCAKEKLKGKGYSKDSTFAPFNARAENKYKDRTVVVYVVNTFMNVGEKVFYEMNGIEVDENAYAISTMVQYIWRSAIREGHKINLYLPSRRMRELLFKWMNDEKEKAMRNNIVQTLPEFNPGEIWAPGVKTLEANASLLGVV